MNTDLQVNLDNNCNLQIKVPEDVKAYLLDQYKMMVSQFNDASRWIDNKSLDAKTKQQFMPVYQNLLHSLSFFHNLLLYSGISQEDLARIVSITK